MEIMSVLVLTLLFCGWANSAMQRPVAQLSVARLQGRQRTRRGLALCHLPVTHQCRVPGTLCLPHAS